MITTINNHEYQLPRLDIFRQFDLSSTLSPVLSIMALNNDRGVLEKTFAKSFTAMCMNMPPEEKQRVLEFALVGTLRKDGVGWAPIFVNGQFQYHDIDMHVMLMLLWNMIVSHKMLDFFAEDPSTLDAPKTVDQSNGSDTSTNG